ncbi:replicative DNA helicase [Changchengzhania lutea]|uniref:replicative DNA helicase n=1 Tax=Changchengzhania lutea TaxID=2049305 RepID=UPI00115D1E0F|nr:replicative DNA helicase [Changchengzhania lutea]
MNQPKQISNLKLDRSSVITLEKGKIPPQAIDYEKSILGCALQFKYVMSEIVEIISDNDTVFYKEAHRHIYLAMLDLFTDSEPIDLLTVSTKLKSKKKLELIGGDFYLIELSQNVTSSAHIDYHCRIIMQTYVKRHAIWVASQMIEESYDETKDVFDLLEESQRSLDDTSKWLLRKKPTDLKSGYDKFLENNQNPTAGIPSKLLSRKLSYYPGDLIIIAARPGMGKTALILNEAKHQAKLKIPVGILSLEMMNIQIIGRLAAEEFSIDAERIKDPKKQTPSEREVLKKEGFKISNLPIQMHDEGNLNIMSAKTIIGKWVRQNGVKIVYIDYLQLMEVSGKKSFGNREQEISYISRTLKGIAKEFEIPIIALSQLSRAVETRGGSKRPILSDLRESGAIEQDADVVAFIYRPEYYKIDEWDDDERGSTKDQCEIDVAKIREGLTGYTRVGCKLKYMRFEDLPNPDDVWEPLPPPVQKPEDAFGTKNVPIEDEKDDLPF